MEKIKAYVALTKPRVIELLLVATIPAMLQEDRGTIHLWLILLTLVGGWMGAAAANSFNMIVDSDIDKVMKRTQNRPLVDGRLTLTEAKVFASSMTVLSFLFLTFLCHSLLSAVFVMLTILFYIFVYTKWLKRRTWQNVIWGGAAGCMPVIVGWAVIADNTSNHSVAGWLQAVALFMIIFFWTPPHTWALGMRYEEDYRGAGVPMMPVVKTRAQVAKQILFYTWLTVLTSLTLIFASCWFYTLTAIGAGAWFIISATRLYKRISTGKPVKPIRLFILSNNYLSLLFVGLSIDAVINLQPLHEVLGF